MQQDVSEIKRMHKQCVPGVLSPLPLRTPGYEATAYTNTSWKGVAHKSTQVLHYHNIYNPTQFRSHYKAFAFPL